MAVLITLVARKALQYNGRDVSAGDVFTTSPVDAAVLKYRGDVDFAPAGAEVRASVSATIEKYESTGMVPPVALTALDKAMRPDDQAPPAKPARKKRASRAGTYRRRDLRAES